ncbi:hypothetical protein AB0L66_27550 [Streptomyces sp. NPDC052207]|uniref:hypothetical protein n=1 Tax=Streptomyces sp. NPDC052207 TaxID=3155418 RepID=UPI003430257B
MERELLERLLVGNDEASAAARPLVSAGTLGGEPVPVSGVPAPPDRGLTSRPPFRRRDLGLTPVAVQASLM